MKKTEKTHVGYGPRGGRLGNRKGQVKPKRAKEIKADRINKVRNDLDRLVTKLDNFNQFKESAKDLRRSRRRK